MVKEWNMTKHQGTELQSLDDFVSLGGKSPEEIEAMLNDWGGSWEWAYIDPQHIVPPPQE